MARFVPDVICYPQTIHKRLVEGKPPGAIGASLRNGGLERSLVARGLKLGYSVVMSTTLRDFIANREGEIRDQLKALKAELKELQLAKGALDGQEPSAAPTATSGPTIKEMAKFVLSTNTAKDGMTSHEILAGIKTEFDRDIDRTSLSPQLSRLKTDGEITLDGEKWFTIESHKDWRRRLALAAMGTNIFATDKPNPDEEENEESVPF